MARVYNSRGRGSPFWNYTALFFFIVMLVIFVAKLVTFTGFVAFAFPGWLVGVAFLLAVFSHIRASTFYPYTTTLSGRKIYKLPPWLERIDNGLIMLPMMVASVVLLFF